MKAIFAAALAACFAVPAAAQEQCGNTADVYAALLHQFGEYRRAAGYLGDMSGWVEVWGNPEGEGTWTIVVSLPTGETCLIASGIGFDTFNAPPNL